MTRLDEIIANALAGIPETDAAILAREVVRLREAPALVVPEPTGRDLQEMAAEMRVDGDLVDFLAGASKVVLWYRSKIRAIPADRVLGDGERKVCSEEWMYLRSLEQYARKHAPESIQDVIGCLDHLRANQGGADHA